LVSIGIGGRDASDGVAARGGGDGNDAPARLPAQHLLDSELGEMEEAVDVCRDEQLDILAE